MHADAPACGDDDILVVEGVCHLGQASIGSGRRGVELTRALHGERLMGSFAIEFAYEVSTHVFKLDPDKIWPTIYQKDDEAFELWRKYFPEEKIVRFGEKENFWAMGEVGPCGPCSELLYDRGSKYGSAKNPYEELPEYEHFSQDTPEEYKNIGLSCSS